MSGLFLQTNYLTSSLYGSVVQLVRTLACHARGQGFETPPNRHPLEVYMIDDKPVIVTDPKKIKEIKEALKSSNIHCINIKPATPSPLPENAAEMWFGKNK